MKKNRKLKKTNEVLDKDHAVLEAKQRRLNKQKRQLEKEIKGLRKHKDKLEEKVAKVTGEKETLGNQLQQLETKMRNTLVEKGEEIKNFKQQLATQTQTTYELNRKLAKAQEKISDSQKKLEQAMLLKQIAEGEKKER